MSLPDLSRHLDGTLSQPSSTAIRSSCQVIGNIASGHVRSSVHGAMPEGTCTEGSVDFQSTLISTLLPSGSRTKVERPLPAAPLLTSACVGSRPLLLSGS